MKLREEIETFVRVCDAAARGNARKRGMKGFADGQRWAADWLKAILKNARPHKTKQRR